MKHWLTIRYLLTALAIVGLVLSPLGRPAIAMSMEMPAAMDDHAAMHNHVAMDMPESMPCCPDTDKTTDCAKACPCMAACIGKIFPMAQDIGLSSLRGLASLIIPRNDAMLGGLAQAPPPRPPKA